MMRSMYSAVSGLKTHQTKMDVIGNNIANVNTVAFKSSSVTFRDILYQTTSGASGANVATGVGGVNAKQIGLGVSMAATSVSIETAGASETTGNPFDIKLTDKNTTNFFIVNDGTQNLFTRAGSFYIDGAGNLCMTSTGYMVMGWQVDPTTNEIRKDTVSALRIMQEKNLTSAPEATTNAVMAGVLDENDADVKSDAGKIMNLNFYDDLGYQYTAKFSVKASGTDGKYRVSLSSILDSNNVDLLAGKTAEAISELFGTSEKVPNPIPLAMNGEALFGVGNTGTLDPVTGALSFTDASGIKTTYSIDGMGRLIEEKVDTINSPTVTDTKIYEFNNTTNEFVYTDTSVTPNTTETKKLEEVFGANAAYSKIGVNGINPKYDIAYNATEKTYVLTETTIIVEAVTEKVFGISDLNDTLAAAADAKIEEDTITANGITYTYNTATQKFDGSDGRTYEITDVLKISDTLREYLGLGAGADPSKMNSDYKFEYNATSKEFRVTRKVPSYDLVFNTANGTFESIDGDPKAVTLKLGDATGEGNVNEKGNFKNISIDFTQCLNYNNSGKSTIGMDAGAVDGTTGKGRKLGNMIGVSIDTSGKIFGSYDNGNTELLGQIAVAQFSNASGLEKVGESCYQTTLNSGEFDGIGVEISADGSSMTTGELEMSNVDLSTEFTQMITTQRGFQANSRVITTSDTLLEELVNLKR